MNTLFVVRHGQASFGADNYDKLSELGILQSRLLGEALVKKKIVLQKTFVGPRVRHRETYDAVAKAYISRSLPWPEAVILDDLDEFRGEALWSEMLPLLMKQDPNLKKLVRDHEEMRDGPEAKAVYHSLLGALVQHWIDGTVETPGMEPWTSFSGRVNKAVDTMVQGDDGQQSMAFTSGGTTGAIVRRALASEGKEPPDLVGKVYNSAITEINYSVSDSRYFLKDYNNFEHLEDPKMLTKL